LSDWLVSENRRIDMTGRPLAWKFAEKAETPSDNFDISYDRTRNLNVVDINGVKRPVVEVKDISLSTNTKTAEKREDTDEDYSDFSSIYGTATTTKAKAEETDSD
jgi:hypothetical protein